MVDRGRRERAMRMMDRLDDAYPDAKVALNHTNPLEMLVATVLSAQCTDKNGKEVTAVLFDKYRAAADYALTIRCRW